MKNKPIGEQIAYWRKKRKLTQKELAEKIGVTNARTIFGYEAGERIPSSPTLQKIADALDCTITITLSGKK